MSMQLFIFILIVVMLFIVWLIYAILKNNAENWSYLNLKEFSELNSELTENDNTIKDNCAGLNTFHNNSYESKIKQLKAKMELAYNLETLDYLTNLENCSKVKPCSKRLKELLMLRKKFQKQVVRSINKTNKI